MEHEILVGPSAWLNDVALLLLFIPFSLRSFVRDSLVCVLPKAMM